MKRYDRSLNPPFESNATVMSFQDWTPVVLRKSQPSARLPRATVLDTTRRANPNRKSTINTRKLEQGGGGGGDDEDGPSYRPPTMTLAMGNQIKAAREKLKLSQAELARKCGLKEEVVRTMEKGQGLYDRKNLDPICRVLKIVISKPK